MAAEQNCKFDLSQAVAPPVTTSGHSHDDAHSHDHAHGSSQDFSVAEHGHAHEHLDHPGKFSERDMPDFTGRDWSERAFTIGIGGPVGSGKTALTLKLCEFLRDKYSLCVLTNDIFIPEDRDFLHSHAALSDPSRIRAIETGGCLHAAIREDISANLTELEKMHREFHPELMLIESGGDNLAANYSRELADFIIYVIDVAGGDKIPRKGGPGISQSDLLVINKTDLAPHVGASLSVMKRDADIMREGGATIFTAVKLGEGVEAVAETILGAWRTSGAIDVAMKVDS